MSIACLRCRLQSGPGLPVLASPRRSLSFRGVIDRIKGKKKIPSRDEDILLQPPPPEAISALATAVPATPAKGSWWRDLSEEEINKIRYKSELPREVLCEQQGIPVHGTRFTFLEHYRRDFVRQYFATYGRASGLKPGVCWPSKAELDFRIKWEKVFYPTFKEMVDRKKAEKAAAEKQMQTYRADIAKKLKRLPQEKKEFFERLNEKKRQEVDEKAKREKILQDVREYLGYDVAPGDSRFQEALAKKDADEEAVRKASRKQEKQAKIMAALTALAEEQVKKAAEAAEKDKSGGPDQPAAAEAGAPADAAAPPTGDKPAKKTPKK